MDVLGNKLLTPRISLRSYEKELLRKGRRGLEYAAFFSKEGEFIEEFKGGIGYVHIPISERKKGQILTHYHDSGTSFGVEDLAAGERFHLSEIRVVKKEGIYSMKSEDNKWPSEEEIRRYANEIKEAKDFQSLVNDELFTEKYGGINQQTAAFMVETDIICKGIAKKFKRYY